ncbi:hypothetical protein [Nibricoccus sp. IMCC34717]|uniref:hypothetical protein n=1 Tax=Nibricoccus sp. IMCC34717 TaxID=3034021 RepID=UPI00384E5238
MSPANTFFQLATLQRAARIAAWFATSQCVAGTIFHYAGWWPNNPLLLSTWLLSLLAVLLVAWLEDEDPPVIRFQWVAAVGILMVLTHWAGMQSGRWNTQGIFDDAAWDLVFARERVATEGVPFQAAFFDDVGGISRETLFHYYIFSFFALFGYNLDVFLTAVTTLTGLNVLFITLSVGRVVPWRHAPLVAFVIAGTYPFLYGETYIAHRYAVAMPLASGAFYFLLGAFQERSVLRASLGGMLTGLCVAGAVMGKQVLVGSVVGAVAILVARRFKTTATERRLAAYATCGALVALIPLLVYIGFNTDTYLAREAGLVREFREKIHADGVAAIRLRAKEVADLFFAPFTAARHSCPDFPVIPWTLLPLVFLGLVAALLRQRFVLVLLAVVPIAGTFASGAFDFRVLIAAPFWILLGAIGAEWLWSRELPLRVAWAVRATVVVLLAGTVVLSVGFIRDMRTKQNPLWLLHPGSVGAVRVIRDAALGHPNPSPYVRTDELVTRAIPDDLPECFLTAGDGFGIATMLFDFLPRKDRLRLSGGLPQTYWSKEELWEQNRKALLAVEASQRDWLLAWQLTEAAEPVVAKFRRMLPRVGFLEYRFPMHFGELRVSTLRIPAAEVPEFLAALRLEEKLAPSPTP